MNAKELVSVYDTIMSIPGMNDPIGYSSPKYATIPPKVRHLFLGKVRH